MPETPSNTMSGWSRPSKQHLNLASILAVLQDISPAAILLGITLNVLDTVSTGLLVFPSSENGSTTFSGLQTQAMSLYVMSTIFSQLAMTLGGSLFPGALGSMLIEVLPFLRNIASSIQDRIGEGDPAILPTVMAAYALTSFLVAFVFIALGLLKCGRLLTLPASSDHLSLGTAGHVLFNQTHLPLLVASVFAALFISVSVRSSFLSKMTRGFTEHALYVPLFCFFIAGLFWVIAAGTKHANADGLDALRSAGWLFTVEKSHRDTGYDWNYWALFDFSLVKWNAMTAAIQDIVLLIVIAVISLPIFIPAMALTLDIPSYNMNWEFFGHGISNLLAGVAGTVPNLVVLTNSKFFTLAGGGRIEALIVTAFTVALFFVSSYLLPYIPTILAATLVLFLGIELMIEALWDAPQSLLIWEWAVVLGTVIACTFIGFAPGVGIGIGMALLVQLWWCNFESRPTIFNLARRPGRRAIAAKNDDRRKSTVISQVDADFYDSSSTLEAQSLPTPTKNRSAISSTENLHAATAQPVIIRLTGYVSFFIISTIEATMKSALKTGNSMIVDFTHATRVETSVAQMLKRQAEMFSISSFTGTLSFAGVLPDSGLLADLKRGGMDCVCMDALQASSASPHFADGATPFFDELDGALNWHARLEDSGTKCP
ncbi:hypothetical protein EJ04DRAFT_594717 [Polyplosphaeria fusca]|uniref:STAS domain-containing protein n=1 Tax=Polyplosphaeria fusca TaxID=682080 RepID=A0A9P4UUU5_9PLEO|nr:hypothetical protein EJ04DRAFT_594717 [Polyplosphaeria fusca]